MTPGTIRGGVPQRRQQMLALGFMVYANVAALGPVGVSRTPLVIATRPTGRGHLTCQLLLFELTQSTRQKYETVQGASRSHGHSE